MFLLIVSFADAPHSRDYERATAPPEEAVRLRQPERLRKIERGPCPRRATDGDSPTKRLWFLEAA